MLFLNCIFDNDKNKEKTLKISDFQANGLNSLSGAHSPGEPVHFEFVVSAGENALDSLRIEEQIGGRNIALLKMEPITNKQKINFDYIVSDTLISGAKLSLIFSITDTKSKQDQVIYSVDVVKKIKVLQYNVWNGGALTKWRGEFLTWIKNIDPDVVAYQELVGFNQNSLLAVAKEYGHSHAEILKTDGYPVGISSKTKISNVRRRLIGMHHGYLYCETAGFSFYVVHLSPFVWEKRSSEARIILNNVSTNGLTKNTIIAGDFNAMSAKDKDYYDTANVLLDAYKKSDDQYSYVNNLKNGAFDYSVIEKFETAGFVDLFKLKNNEFLGSYPTRVFSLEAYLLKQERIDYIFTTSDLADKCSEANIIRDQMTDQMSDHYPVLVVF